MRQNLWIKRVHPRLLLTWPLFFRRQQTGVWARPQRHPPTRRPSSPAHVPRPQPRPARPRGPPRRPAFRRPTQPPSRPPVGPPPLTPGHPPPPPIQVPQHLRTLSRSQDQAVAVPLTQHQRTHVSSPHESRHGQHVLSHQRALKLWLRAQIMTVAAGDCGRGGPPFCWINPDVFI